MPYRFIFYFKHIILALLMKIAWQNFIDERITWGVLGANTPVFHFGSSSNFKIVDHKHISIALLNLFQIYSYTSISGFDYLQTAIDPELIVINHSKFSEIPFITFSYILLRKSQTNSLINFVGGCNSDTIICEQISDSRSDENDYVG